MHRILTIKQVSAALGITRVTLYKMRKRGEFINAVQVSERRIGFREADFQHWLSSRTIH